MLRAGDKRLPERPVICPFGKNFVDRRVVDDRLPIGVCRAGQALPLHARVEEPENEVKDAMIAYWHFGPRLGIERCGKINAVNSLSDSCTGIGVVAGFAVAVLIRQGPQVKQGDSRWRIKFLQILQEVRSSCKTRNQLDSNMHCSLTYTDSEATCCRTHWRHVRMNVVSSWVSACCKN